MELERVDKAKEDFYMWVKAGNDKAKELNKEATKEARSLKECDSNKMLNSACACGYMPITSLP